MGLARLAFYLIKRSGNILGVNLEINYISYLTGGPKMRAIPSESTQKCIMASGAIKTAIKPPST